MGAAAERTLTGNTKAADKARAVRLDPKFRPTNGATPWMRIKNADPNRHYVWASERGVQAGEFDVDYYTSLHENIGEKEGYVVETYDANSPQPVAGITTREKGQPVRFRGHILVSCTLAFKRLLEQLGDDGSSGQAGADFMDNLYKKRGAYADTKRIATAAGIRLEKNPRATQNDSDYSTRVDGREQYAEET